MLSFLRRAWCLLFALIFRFYACVCNRLKISGTGNIPASGGVLIASNHISGYDTIFIPAAVITRYPMEMLWAPAKEELFANWFMRAIFLSWGAFPVKRGRDVRAGRQIGDLLADQRVMIFPEGTRHKDGKLGGGNRGVGKLILDHRPVVIPTALTGINRWKFPGFGQKGGICFGPPLDLSDLLAQGDTKETHIAIVNRVMDAIAGLLPPEMKNTTP